MNYLDYPRHDDRSESRRLKDELTNLRGMMSQRMLDARFWKKHGNAKRVRNSASCGRRRNGRR